MDDQERLNCRKRAARLLSYRAMSKGELRRKLTLKGESREAADDAVEYLAELGFLNEAQYASDVVLHYSRKGYNEWRIKQELRRHLVPRELWEDAIAELDPDDE